jgi:signal transduction histidine kinase
VLEAAGISYTLHSSDSLHSLKLTMQQKKNLYLIFKEAVNNLAKYSNSSLAVIRFEYSKKLLQMTIADEGIGFTLTSIKKGNGLDNMQVRAAELNAQFEIQSEKGCGTTVRVHVPI